MQTDQPTPDHLRRMDDAAVLAAIQRREDAALAELYDRYGRPALGVADRILGDRGVAEEIVQEAFLAIWRRAADDQPERGGGRAWLMTTVHRLAVDRRRGRDTQEQPRMQPGAGDTFVAAAESIGPAQVRQALTSLPTEQRQAVELAYFDGLTHQEVAERTDTSLDTVKSRILLGLQNLRSTLSKAMAPPDQPRQSPEDTDQDSNPDTAEHDGQE